MKFSHLLKNRGNYSKEEVRTKYINNIRENCRENLIRMDQTAFQLLKNESMFSDCFTSNAIEYDAVSELVMNTLVFHFKENTDLLSNASSLINNLTDVKRQYIKESEILEKKIQRVKLHKKRNMVIGIVLLLTGILSSNVGMPTLVSLIMIFSGAFLTVFNVGNVENEIDEIDELEEKLNNNFYGKYIQSAYKINNFILNDLYPIIYK